MTNPYTDPENRRLAERRQNAFAPGRNKRIFAFFLLIALLVSLIISAFVFLTTGAWH